MSSIQMSRAVPRSLRHAGNARSFTKTAAQSRAITLDKFLTAFSQTWTERSARFTPWSTFSSQPLPRTRWGLAVSGGADSMALAYLAKQAESSGLVHGLAVTAFVVDHKAREESSREAKMVAQWLSEMGIKAQILDLEWPDLGVSGTPKLSAFETHARRLRYQALGKACRDQGIPTLLLGHHQDDNIETTLWRLSSGARGSGLAGIPQVAPIPECHGLYGVAESGSSYRVVAGRADGSVLRVRENGRNELQMDTSTLAPVSLSVHMSHDPASSDHPPSASVTTVSTGGILLCRPLLRFPKADLLTTCHENEIPYVSDPTNFDPTLTPRNAIRSLMSSHHLPRALGPSSILSLAKSSRDLLQDSTNLSNQLLGRCRILNINLRPGMMVVQFLGETPSPASILSTSQRSTKDVVERARQIQTLTLRRITELLSPFPENHFSLRSFEPFSERIFGPLSYENVTATWATDKFLGQRQSFTLGGVMFRPVRNFEGISENGTDLTPSTSSAHELSWPHPSTHTQKIATSPEMGRNIWLLSRQPFMRNRLPITQIRVPMTSKKTTQRQPGTTIEKQNPMHWSQWTLWDNRYWFRLAVAPKDTEHHNNHNDNNNRPPLTKLDQDTETNQTTCPLTIRPFRPTDLQRINDHLKLIKTMKATAAAERADTTSFSTTTTTTTTTTHLVNDQRQLLLLQNIKRQVADEAPGLLRFCLPLVSLSKQCMDATQRQSHGQRQHESDDGDGGRGGNERSEQILALPTLQQSAHTGSRSAPGSGSGSGEGDLSGQFTYASRSWILNWEWMYKMVDTEVLRRMSS